MAAGETLKVTDVVLRNGDKVIEEPSVEQLAAGIVYLANKIQTARKRTQELLDKNSQEPTNTVGEVSADLSFEEPEEADLQAALNDIKSRFGLSSEEYEERYCLQNVDTEKITFTAFKKRLEEAPIEKRVHFVNAFKAERELVPFRINERGEFGLMNPRQINTALVNREFNAWGAEQNGRDPEQSIVSILRSQGMEPATKTAALHVTALHGDKCEGVYWLYLAPRENMTPEELDKAHWAAGFDLENGRSDLYDRVAHCHGPLQGGLGVLWV